MRHLLVLFAAAALLPAQDPVGGLPVVPPVFQAASGTRIVPELRVSSFAKEGVTYAQPSLVLGNKRIGFRELANAADDFAARIVIDNREVLSIRFWGDAGAGNWGYPFKVLPGKPARITADAISGAITYAKPYRQTDGAEAVFTYRLTPAGAGKVEVAWDLGVAQARIDADPRAVAGVNPWLAVADAAIPFTLDGQPVMGPGTVLAEDKDTRLAVGERPQVVFEPARELAGFSFMLPEGFPLDVVGRNVGGKAKLMLRSSARRPVAHAAFVIDFGNAAPAAGDAPKPVGGIDFWGQDRLDVPASLTRNLLPNPSFEQGLRYWAWWRGGGRYVPGEVPEYAVGDDGCCGPRCLLIRPGRGGMAAQSFTIPVVKDHAYTVSFYAKGEQPGAKITVGVVSPLQGTKLEWPQAFKSQFPLTATWERHAFTVTADTPAISLLIAATSVARVDGIQVEEGREATAFVAPEVEGVLLTADPDNSLAAGQPLAASFEVRGTAGASGEVAVRLDNVFQESVFALTSPYVLDASGTARIALPIDAAKAGTGVFVLRSEIHPQGGAVLRDFHRLSIMAFLENRHATKDLFGTLQDATRITRGAELARNHMRWGFGSTTYAPRRAESAALLDEYRIRDFLRLTCDGTSDEERAFCDEIRHRATAISAEQAQRIEDISFRTVSAMPGALSWAFSTESEISPLIQAGNFAEWTKVQLAYQRGVKRAKPEAIVLPDGGPSGFNRLRGQREMEGYLAATQGKVRWDAIAVHPYGDLDGVAGTSDLDVELQRLIDLMQQYGYGKNTPIDLTEGFNYCPVRVQEWSTSCNDYYNNGKPSYAFGWAEYIHAAWAARSYLMALKYWPQVRSFNIWINRTYLDQQLSPLALCAVPNTLGHLLGKPTWKADVRPAAGVRGYVFEDEAGRGVAALWSTIDRVDEGLEAGPVLSVRFAAEGLEFIDLMGNQRRALPEQGRTAIPLGSAPLFIRCAAGGAAQLAKDLADAEVSGAASALRVVVQPERDGSLEAVASNLTGREVAATLSVNGSAQPLRIPAKGSTVLPLPGRIEPTPGRLNAWGGDLAIGFPNGRSDAQRWDMQFFYVPHAARPLPLDPAAVEWAAVPAIPLTNWHIKHEAGSAPVAGGYPGDLDARFQLAWDSANLYLRVVCVDDRFVLTDPARWKPVLGGRDPQLYENDGCLEVYFDTGANGRSNTFKGFDLDDYRYDVYAGSPAAVDGPGSVFRLREVFHQLAGGIDMPTKDDAARGIGCRFRREGNSYSYVLIFPQRFIEPLKLETGWRAGFGLFIHDNDTPELAWPGKGLSLAGAPGAHCDARPDLWPIMVLRE